MDNETLFKKKLSLLMTLGSEYSLASLEDEQYLYNFDNDLRERFGVHWNEKWESKFSTDKEKILLLKGIILLEKICEKKGKKFLRGSTTITPTIFQEVERRNLLNSRLFDWIIRNRCSNVYTPFGGAKYSHIENYTQYLEFIDNKTKRERTHNLDRELKKKKMLKKAEDHKIREKLSKKRNEFKNKLAKDYFIKNGNKFLDDIISQKLPFPLDLTPKEQINNVISKKTKLSNSELVILIARIPRKSASHIKKFKKLLVEELNSR
mgnify:FL=1